MKNLEATLDSTISILESVVDAATKMIEAGTRNEDMSLTIPEPALKGFASELVKGALAILVLEMGK